MLLSLRVDGSSSDIKSVSRFFQCEMLTFFLDFQFMRIVFLAIVSATSRNVMSVAFKLVTDVSPSMHRDGVAGM